MIYGTLLWMKTICFYVPGIPRGYTTTTYKGKFIRGGKDKSYENYVNYCKEVRISARKAGVDLPINTTKDSQWTVSTIAYFKDGRHPDPENIRKGVADALCYQEDKIKGSKKGNDKYCAGCFLPPRYDKDNPRVFVVVEKYDETDEHQSTTSLRNIETSFLER